MIEYAAEHKKPSSQANEQKNIGNHIIPLLGHIYVADVNRGDALPLLLMFPSMVSEWPEN